MIYNYDLQLRNRNSVDNQTNQANTANQSNATAILYLIKVNVIVNCKNMILNTYATQFDDCTKDVLRELHVQEEEMSDSDEESAEVEDK